MKPHLIQLKIKLDSIVSIKLLLVEFFTRDKSSILPIYVNEVPLLLDSTQYIFGIYEIRNLDEIEEELQIDYLFDEKLAEIRIQSYPSLVLAIIDGTKANGDNWVKVKKAVREIVKKAQELGFEFISTDPPEFMPKIIIDKQGIQTFEFPSKPEPVKLPPKPEKPKKGSNLDSWFKYYHDCKENGIKYTLSDLADDAGFSYGHVRELHRQFIASNKDLTDSDQT
jgi:hypothetical protein